MGKDRNFRALAIAAICIAIVCVSVAYAALSAVLNINGTATVSTSTSWKVHFDESTITTINKTGNTVVTKEPTLKTDDTTILEWAARFSAPGDSISFSVNVKNSGSINAVLDEITKTIEDTNADVPVASYFKYEVTVGGQNITEAGLTDQITKRLLNSGASTTVTIKVTFDSEGTIKDSATLEALNMGSVSFKLKLGFAQAAESDASYGTLS